MIYNRTLGVISPRLACAVLNDTDPFSAFGHYAEAEPLYQRRTRFALGCQDSGVLMQNNGTAGRVSPPVDLADDCTQFLETATDGVPLTSAEEDGKAGHAIGPFTRANDR